MNAEVLSSTLTAVASLSSALAERFKPFYTSFMPAVLALLSQPTLTAEQRGKALEAAGTITITIAIPFIIVIAITRFAFPPTDHHHHLHRHLRNVCIQD